MNLCVIGTGYVGLVGSAVFADWGNNVIGVDIDKVKIRQIKMGKMPLYEPGLSELVSKGIKSGKLKFTTKLKEGITNSEIIFICVGTPQGDSGEADLSAVLAVAEKISQNIKNYKVIVTKSTVPIGTNEKIKYIIKQKAKNIDFDVVSNPEFLREGFSIEDMRNTDRTIIGAENERAFKIMSELYSNLGAPIVECDLRSAELIKYTSNAFLATKISFINEIGQLCERAGADVSIVARGMGLDKRIGKQFLNAGIGYGGSCFPKDVTALYRTSTDQAYDFKLLRSVMEVNIIQRQMYLKKIERRFGSNLSGKNIACLGLAFKAGTDDIRESVAIEIIKCLRGMGAYICVYDPQAVNNSRLALGSSNIEYFGSLYSCVKGADALCILTEWEEFKAVDLQKVKMLLKTPVIFDGRNVLDKKEAEKFELEYYATGKSTKASLEDRIKQESSKSGALLKNGS